MEPGRKSHIKYHKDNLMRRSFTPAIIAACLLSGCKTPPVPGTRIDEIPMYGGLDRASIPELKIGDERFVSEVSAQFGTKEKASAIWVNQGYRFYEQDRLGMSLRRFNQAWLLDPTNPEVYAGFAAVLHTQAKYCDAMKMMEKSLALDPPTFKGIYPDAARTLTLCAVNDQTLSDEVRAELIDRSEALYQKAETVEPDKRYVFSSRATAYYWCGQYEKAWKMVARAQDIGDGSGAIAGMPSRAIDQPSVHFLNMLRSKMPEPNR